MGLIARVFVPGKVFQPSEMFQGKARGNLSEATFYPNLTFFVISLTNVSAILLVGAASFCQLVASLITKKT
jgi:hypothetical protein